MEFFWTVESVHKVNDFGNTARGGGTGLSHRLEG
jgi:hypothetical protein